MPASSKRKVSPYSAKHGFLRLLEAAKTARFWAAALAFPLTLLAAPATLSGLLSPVILLKVGFNASYFLVSALLFACSFSVASVLIFVWFWIAAGRAPVVRDRRRRRFFFLLLCAGDLALCYFGILLVSGSVWIGLLFFLGAAALGRGLYAAASGAKARA